MSVRRTNRIRTATVLAGVTAVAVTGIGAAAAAPTATADGTSSVAAAAGATDPNGSADPVPDVSNDVQWPAELTEHTRLFVNPYRSYLVQIRNGRPTLVLSTGFDSCYVMTQNGQQRYPC